MFKALNRVVGARQLQRQDEDDAEGDECQERGTRDLARRNSSLAARGRFLGGGFQVPVAVLQKLAQMPADHDHVCQPSEDTPGHRVLEAISHEGEAVRLRLEEMIVLHLLEGPRDHLVTEVTWTVEGRDAAGETQPHSKVPCFPSHLVTRPQESARDAPDRTFPRWRGGFQVSVDRSGEIEDDVRRGGNPHLEV